MKKIYSLIVVSFFTFYSVIAQNNVSLKLAPMSLNKPISLDVLTPSDSMLLPGSFSPNPLACENGLTGLTLTNGQGYPFGNAIQNALPQSGQKYYISGTALVKQVLVYCFHTYLKPNPGTSTAKIYSISPSKKGPLAVLGTSTTVSTADVDITGGFTTYTFANPVSVNTSFVAAIVYPTNGDSMALACTTPGCATTDSLSWIYYPAQGGWKSFKAMFGGQSNNVDACVFPVLDFTSGINEFPRSMGLTLKGTYPNPAQRQVTIKYDIENNSSVNIIVFDQSGRFVSNSTERKAAGSNEFKLELNNIASGNYYYTISTDAAKLTSDFTVVK